jgi:fumarate hydratase class II
MADMRKKTDSIGVVEVPEDKLRVLKRKRSFDHSTIGRDSSPAR